MTKETTYGQKDGVGPTRGKKATAYRVTLPDGSTVTKRIFRDLGPSGIATGFMHNGKTSVVVWEGEPAWEGDFGRLRAERL